MSCPFPGMDPYLECPSIWGDFHDSLIFCLRAALVPLLRPKYAPLTQDRHYVVEARRPLFPDVAIVRNPKRKSRSEGAAAVLEPDAPTVFQLWREEIRQPYLTIIEPHTGRVITAIEVLSPDNKRKGPGRRAYLKKRKEFWDSGTNLIEVDLLSEGRPTVRISPKELAELQPWRYLVAVSRYTPAQQEVYGIALRERLPRISVPLAEQDPDVTLDLQSAFRHCWDSSPYPDMLGYDEAPPAPMSDDDLRWCETILRESGERSGGPRAGRASAKRNNGKRK